VGEIQRVRMLSAMAEVVCERGAGDVSVAHVVERAGVSRRTFYEIFDDREDCLLAAFDEAIVRARGYVSAGYDSTAEWEERLRSALEAFLRFLEDEPALGRLAVVESLGIGSRAREMRQAVLARIVAEVDAGRKRAVAGCSTRLTAEGVVGGVSSVIQDRLLSGDGARLQELVNPLMSMVVLPYLGPDAAHQELTRPVAKVSLRGPAPAANPLKGLDMRLTYRTMRVLRAVETNPNSSNRAIGDASGVGDQGQISKLLARLRRLGLVDNARVGHSRSAANAWTLTPQGEEVANVIRARSTGS
jgi:AcrR family transcriptional regulator/DNA-binding MarR family transcriptional regulator